MAPAPSSALEPFCGGFHSWWSCPSSHELAVRRFRPSLSLSLIPLLSPVPAPLPSGGWPCRLRCLTCWGLRPSRLLVLSCQVPVCVPQDPRGLASSRRFLPPSRGGSALLLSCLRPPSPFFRLCPGLWVVFLDLYSACLLVPVPPAFFISGPSLALSSATWLFYRILPPVSSVLPLLGSRLLCSHTGWLVLGSAFQVLVGVRAFLLCLCSHFGVLVLPSGGS